MITGYVQITVGKMNFSLLSVDKLCQVITASKYPQTYDFVTELQTGSSISGELTCDLSARTFKSVCIQLCRACPYKDAQNAPMKAVMLCKAHFSVAVSF